MVNKKINLYSNDFEIKKIIEQYKTNNKVYLKFLEVMSLLGNFDGKTNIEIYEIIDEENEKKIKLWCSDINEDIFIFCPVSSSKKDLNLLEKITNIGTVMYDLSLCKKYVLTNDNIDLIKTNKIYNFKFGRLITDEKSFYNMFLGNDICYQIEIDFKEEKIISVQNLLDYLNKLESVPTFKEYVEMFESLLSVDDFQMATLSAYKNFIRNGSIKIDNNIEFQKKIIKQK